MSSFNSTLIFTILLLSLSQLQGCGKKAPLYHPDVDKGEAQSDQSFVFPPTSKDKPNSTQP